MTKEHALRAHIGNGVSLWEKPILTEDHCSIRSIAWNPLGSLIATGAVDKTLRVWNPERPFVSEYSIQFYPRS